MTAFHGDGRAAGGFAHDFVLYLAVLLSTSLIVLLLVPLLGQKESLVTEQIT